MRCSASDRQGGTRLYIAVDAGRGRQYDSFTVYSSVMLRGPVEGSNELADQIVYEPRVRWCGSQIKSDAYQTTGVARFRAYVVSV